MRQAVNAGTDPGLHESAILLARTMYEARNTEGVKWVSETGGSGVITQALKILVDQGVNLKESKHSIFLCNPTTRVSTIQALSIQLDLGQPRRINRSNPLKPDELVGGLGFGGGYVTAYVRLQNDKNYGLLKFTGDVFKETTSLNGAGGVAGNVASGVGLTASVAVAVGLTAGGIAMPAVLTFAAAVLPAVGLSKTLTEAYLPRIYKKIAGKF